jgi:hypothetical protein
MDGGVRLEWQCAQDLGMPRGPRKGVVQEVAGGMKTRSPWTDDRLFGPSAAVGTLSSSRPRHDTRRGVAAGS